MQILQPSAMALTAKDIPWFIFLHLGGNQIGNEGCELLSHSKWPLIEILNLGVNNISSEGIKHLCKANWPQLKKLTLRTVLVFRF
jgi:hypothetical protein